MSDRYTEPARESETEKKIKKSLFIAHVRICPDEEAARERLRAISAEHRQANHNCWAYRVGAPRPGEYYSDDGEPAGTAGKPILGAILRRNVTNVLVVVTRYFGGIKLGVRGLIEAYGSVADEGLLSSGTVERRIRRRYEIRMPYDMVKPSERLLESCDTGEEYRSFIYEADIVMGCSVPVDCACRFEEILREWKSSRRIADWTQNESRPS